MMMYGVLDVVDNCWLGNREGPLLYDDFTIASLAREVLTHQMGWDASRVEVRPFQESGLRLRDELIKIRSGVESVENFLDKKERGVIL